jgi:hypothetical protein
MMICGTPPPKPKPSIGAGSPNEHFYPGFHSSAFHVVLYRKKFNPMLSVNGKRVCTFSSDDYIPHRLPFSTTS